MGEMKLSQYFHQAALADRDMSDLEQRLLASGAVKIGHDEFVLDQKILDEMNRWQPQKLSDILRLK